MSLDIANKGIVSTFERAVSENIEYVEILFHGGEPFMAYKRIREICEWLWAREWPVNYICYATTNGTLIHGEIKEWLLKNKHRFCLGLSLDGTRDMHNRNRSNSYEKIDIAKKYLIPKILEENKIDNKIISIGDEMLSYLIESYTCEAGVRELYRALEGIIRKLVVKGRINERTKISKIRLKEYLGIPKFGQIENKKHEFIGRVNGLGVTNSGGKVMPIESCVFEGKGNFNITGMLGKTMEESTNVALSFIKSHSEVFKMKDFFFNLKDIHIHFLEGAIKKDGPSAGVAIITSILSLILDKKISNLIAFTGEISLNGDILKVGGIKEKIIGAYNNNITTVYIPYDNEYDLEEIPEEIKNKITIKLVKNYLEIYEELFIES